MDHTCMSPMPTLPACSHWACMVFCWTSLRHAFLCTIAQIPRLVLAFQTVFVDLNFSCCWSAVDQGCCCVPAGQQQLCSIPHPCNDTKYLQNRQKCAIRMLFLVTWSLDSDLASLSLTVLSLPEYYMTTDFVSLTHFLALFTADWITLLRLPTISTTTVILERAMCNRSALVYFVVKQLAWWNSTAARQGQIPFVTIKASTYAPETLVHMTCMTERQVNVGQQRAWV